MIDYLMSTDYATISMMINFILGILILDLYRRKDILMEMITKQFQMSEVQTNLFVLMDNHIQGLKKNIKELESKIK
jgi:hypothetical protein